MINVAKDVKPWCENCRKFEPVTDVNILQYLSGNLDVTVTVRCANHEPCNLAVSRYRKFKEQEQENEKNS